MHSEFSLFNKIACIEKEGVKSKDERLKQKWRTIQKFVQYNVEHSAGL